MSINFTNIFVKMISRKKPMNYMLVWFFFYLLSHFPRLKISWSIANPPLVAFPSITTRKSDLESTVTWPGNHSGRAVFNVVADICQIWKLIQNGYFYLHILCNVTHIVSQWARKLKKKVHDKKKLMQSNKSF